MQFQYSNGSFALEGKTPGADRLDQRWKSSALDFGLQQTRQAVYSSTKSGLAVGAEPLLTVKLSQEPGLGLNFEYPPNPASDAHAWDHTGLYCTHVRYQYVLGGKGGTQTIPNAHTFFWRAVPLRGRRGRLQPLAEGARRL